MARAVQFIIPAKKDLRPKVLRKLAESDYLCQIKDPCSEKNIAIRVVFVHRNGFRRRRLVTSLLDPIVFPASELARLYHMRWDIETFYRDFKCTLRATCWHCQTPESFHQELVMHMIVCCLIRIAMLEGLPTGRLSVRQLSFARALTETRLFLRLLLSITDVDRGLPSGQHTCIAALITVSNINQTVDLQGIDRNIEERVAAWRSATKIINVSISRLLLFPNPKLVRDRKDRNLC